MSVVPSITNLYTIIHISCLFAAGRRFNNVEVIKSDYDKQICQ
jgi:hypothetical protein